MPSIWANFNHVFEVFQGLFSAFLLYQKDGLGTRLAKTTDLASLKSESDELDVDE